MSNTNWIGSGEGRGQQINRALDVAGAGSELLQTFINRTVQQLTLREFGLQAVLPRKAGSGDAEYINRRTAGTAGAVWEDDITAPAVENGTYAQVSFPYVTAVTRGTVTRKLQATGRTYADVLALELSAKAEDFANQLELGYLRGNAKYDGGNLDNANDAPKGFITMVFANQGQIVAAGTTVPGDLTLSKLDEAIDLVKGSAARQDLVIVGSFAGLRQVNSLLQADQVFNDVTEVAAGFRVKTYDGIPLVVSTAMPNDALFDAVNGTVFRGASGAAISNSTILMVLNKRYCYISELTPTTVLPLAKTTSQNDSFDMYWDGAPVLSNTLGAAAVSNIKLS